VSQPAWVAGLLFERTLAKLSIQSWCNSPSQFPPKDCWVAVTSQLLLTTFCAMSAAIPASSALLHIKFSKTQHSRVFTHLPSSVHGSLYFPPEKYFTNFSNA